MKRRTFLTGIAGIATASRFRDAEAQVSPIPIIDTHIHLFDPARRQPPRAGGAPPNAPASPAADTGAQAGAPPPGRAGGRGGGVFAQPALPPRYRAVAIPAGVIGAIEVEASVSVDEGQWVLETVQPDDLFVGTVGNLELDTPAFDEQLARFRRNRLFRGTRYGNLWNRDILRQVNENPLFIENLKKLAQADLVLDSANPNLALLQALATINDRVPNLRIVVDHLPRLARPAPGPDRDRYDALLRELKARPSIYVKLSEIVTRVNGEVPLDVSFHRENLDRLFETFGEDRVLFGSDWPVSEALAPMEQVVGLVQEYFSSKPRRVAEKYFWRNSLAVYKWVSRSPAQAALVG